MTIHNNYESYLASNPKYELKWSSSIPRNVFTKGVYLVKMKIH